MSIYTTGQLDSTTYDPSDQSLHDINITVIAPNFVLPFAGSSNFVIPWRSVYCIGVLSASNVS